MRCPSCNKSITADSAFCRFCGTKLPATAPKPRKNSHAPNGTGYVYKRGKTWTIRVRSYIRVLGQPHSYKTIERTKGGFPTARDAKQYAFNLTASRSAPKTRPLGYYWSVYEHDTLPNLSNSKQINYRTAWQRLSDLQDHPTPSITVSDLRDAASKAGTSWYAAHDIKVLASALFTLAAAEDPSVNKNLPSFIILPPKKQTTQDSFTAEEVASIYSAYSSGVTFCGYILVMIYTSMMPGELLKLEKANIDLDAQTISHSGLKTSSRKKALIHFPPFLTPVLSHLSSLHDGPRLLPQDIYYAEKFTKLYYDALAQAGTRKLVPYSCRHTTQTLLALDPSVTPAARAAAMRHTIRMEDTYTHVSSAFPSAAKSAIDSMPDPPTLASMFPNTSDHSA